MAVVKYKNPNYVDGGTEPKYIPILNSSGIEDAPLDGLQYARQNGGWVEVSSSGGSIDASEIIEKITLVVNAYREELNAAVGDMTPVMNDINDEEEIDAACEILDEINGEVI